MESGEVEDESALEAGAGEEDEEEGAEEEQGESEQAEQADAGSAAAQSAAQSAAVADPLDVLETSLYHLDIIRARYRWLLQASSTAVAEAKNTLYESDRAALQARGALLNRTANFGVTLVGSGIESGPAQRGADRTDRRLRLLAEVGGRARGRVLEEVRGRLRPVAERLLVEAARLQPAVEQRSEVASLLWARQATASGRSGETLRGAQAMVVSLAKVMRPLLDDLRRLSPDVRTPAETATLQVLERAAKGRGQAGSAMYSEKVCFVSDVRGHWAYFCSVVKKSRCLRFMKRNRAHEDDMTVEDSRLELAKDWHFVYGGNTCDEGPNSILFTRTLIDLKRRYPDRVHLLMGDRDVGKMRLTSELQAADGSMGTMAMGVSDGKDKTTATPKEFMDFVKTMSTKDSKRSQSEIAAMKRQHSMKVNRLRYMLAHTMGAEEAFRLRRLELGHLSGRPPREVSDEEVVLSFEDSVDRGGFVREYLELADLAVLIGGTLCVHGNIVGNTFRHSGGAHRVVGVVPSGDGQEFEPDVQEWLWRLNEWGKSEVADWIRQPVWAKPPKDFAEGSWSGRGGAGLIAYGSPASKLPSVLTATYSRDSKPMKPLPPDLVLDLTAQGVRRVLHGHVPAGSGPSVAQLGGLTVVNANTCESSRGADLAFKGDNRGLAAYEVAVTGDEVRIRGVGLDGCPVGDAGDSGEEDEGAEEEEGLRRASGESRRGSSLLEEWAAAAEEPEEVPSMAGELSASDAPAA